MLAEVDGQGRVVALRGDPDHPVTDGFLCLRTNRFLDRQYHPSRILRPLLKRGDRQVEIPLEEALDMAAERLMAIRRESGPAAIFHYRSGGSLGLLKVACDFFFESFGPTTTKRGDICSGGGDAAQDLDFGDEDGHDVFDVLNARHVINWGKNVFVSSVHMVGLLKKARARGATLTLVDPIHTRAVQASDDYLAIRPGGDAALALAVGRMLFETGAARIEACDNVDSFRALCFSQSLEALLDECDLSEAQVRGVADHLCDGPTAILVGWGLQRRLRGASTVRLLDALCAVSGNLGRAGGGVFFSTRRSRPFNTSFLGRRPPPRRICEPLLGEEVLAARDPAIRAMWVTCGNPVAMLPDSARVAQAFERTEFVVAVDAFPTDTTRRATLVLPTTTMLEDDDLIGSYGHHYLGVSRPVVPPPPGVLTDLQLMQELARRVGLQDVMAGSPRDWKVRLLAGGPTPLEEVERGPVRTPLSPPVLFADGKVATASGRVNLIDTLPPAPQPEDGYPLWLFSNSSDRAQSSQWAVELDGPLTVTLHPSAAAGLADGATARLVSAIGALVVRLKHDARQRPDVAIIPKGGHFDRGHAANALIRARTTDLGEGAAYLDCRVRVEPDASPVR